MKKMTLNILVLTSFFLFVACASSPVKKGNPRDAFTSHWKQTGNSVQVTQVVPVQKGMYRGTAIVDGRPVEEFYDPSTGEFTDRAPIHGAVAEAEEKKMLYSELMIELANDLNLSIPNNSRIAVLDFPSDDEKKTKLSSNLALKLEMGLAQAGREIVDRGKIEEVLKEHKLQQSQNVLFEPSTSARLGQFVGATTVVIGSYHLSPSRMLKVSAKAVSVETTRVIVVKEKEIPLNGNGSANREEITELTQGP